jgi:alpha-galactosidase
MNRREFLALTAMAPLAASSTERDAATGWARSFVGAPPFSFTYGGRLSTSLLPRWKYAQNATGHTYTDPETGLIVRATLTAFPDFPAVEWVLEFENPGTAATPILEDIRPLDTLWRSPGGDPVIHYARGATCSMDDYEPLRRVLNAKGRLDVQPGGGRSSSDYLPFFNLEWKGGGVVVGIGWSGEWAASFIHDTGPEFRARAGMALTHLKLEPGERIRTPRILTLFWEGGDRLRGHNLLRRFLLRHHHPPAGRMPLCHASWGGSSAEVHLANIRVMLEQKLPADYYWIDAEWFGTGKWHKNPGDWRVKQDLYPQGFKPISDTLHKASRKFLLWFEPERVCEGTPWDREHPEWLLQVPKAKRVYNWGASQADPAWVRNESFRNQIVDNDRLFNLGVPEARRFFTDYLSARIDEFGIDCFRHDANIAPLEFWRAADAPDRQGITEIRWVTGLYAFWDELLRRHPGLVIDNCASGGRRIDLESLDRTLPLYRTDFAENSIAHQCHSLGLMLWVPQNATSAGGLIGADNYRVRSAMSSGMEYGLFDRPGPPKSLAGIPFDQIRRTLEQYRSIQKYYYGDYYPLTHYSQAADAWMAYQLDLPESGEGLVVALKRPASPFPRAAFQLRGLDRDASYEVRNLDGGPPSAAGGAELLDRGLEVTLPGKPDSALLHYRRQPRH